MDLGSMFVGLPSPAPDTDFDSSQLDSAAASASQPGAHPRMFLTPEKKLGHDTRPYTAEQFIQRYGEAGRDLWLHAPPPVAARYVERRFAPDGRLLKFVDFARHYGSIALDAWNRAPQGQPCAPCGSLLMERRVALDMKAYTWYEFVAHYGPVKGSAIFLASGSHLDTFGLSTEVPSDHLAKSSGGASQPAAPQACPPRPPGEWTPSSAFETPPLFSSLMEAMMHKKFRALDGEERRSAITECLLESEHALQQHLKTLKLMQERIVILNRFLSSP